MSDERKSQLKKAFELATSIDEVIKVFKQMETCFPESELGPECFLVAHGLYREKRDLDHVLSFAKTALTILRTNNDNDHITCNLYLTISSVFGLLGSVYRDFGKYDLSLSYFNQADAILSQLLLDKDEEDYEIVIGSLLNTHIAMCNINSALGRNREAVVNARKILEINEKMYEDGCLEIGMANYKVVERCLVVYDHEEALPFCLKALEIYRKFLGRESVEVGKLTRYLSLIYGGMGECEKAFECNQLAQSVFRKVGSSDLVKVRIESGNMLVDLGRYQEAVDVLMGVVPSSDIEERAKMLVYMARAKAHLGKFDQARDAMKVAQRLLERKGVDPMLVVVGYADMSEIYETTKNFETAIVLIKEALAMSEVPQKFIPVFSDRLFSLFSISGKKEEGLPYMEGVVERMKESFGPHHLSSLKAGHALSVCYADLGRYRKALETEEKVVEGLHGLEAGELGFLHEVNKHLSEMRERVAESSTNDDEGLSTKISECSVSDDGKVLE